MTSRSKRRTMRIDADDITLDGDTLIIDQYGTQRRRVTVMKLNDYTAAAFVERLALFVRRNRDRAMESLSRMKEEASK